MNAGRGLIARVAVAGLSAEAAAGRFFGFEGLDSCEGEIGRRRMEPEEGADESSLKAAWHDLTERPATRKDQLGHRAGLQRTRDLC